MNDSINLHRFTEAQEQTYDTALAEIRGGRKQNHWIWFIFPQIAGLGHSPTAQYYAIGSLDEARAYLDHPVLGPRLIACVEALQDLQGTTAEQAFGATDAMKLRSSLTLFIEAGAPHLFTAALDRWFQGVKDPATLNILARG
ncbi:calpastatin [Tardibacter chloracetimidivorans]|uniref:Calpastatin n=1 Tax=Tardibacter chloracetimidivorans TaxID=1921510 RepID=A0A1L3ZUK4_9SPHN|nr:DUF1810 domain-containing protein [Tardibacter chloracetimidivorans]API59313.1 calpastatin [Tardibacter chloracetimidivorans]